MRRSLARHQALLSVMAQARVKAGLSQRQLSAKLKVSVNYVQRIESGERDVGVDEFVEFSEAVGADPIDLLKQALKKRTL